MINIYIWDRSYEHDVQTLSKAFYPDSIIKIEELNQASLLSSLNDTYTVIIEYVDELLDIKMIHGDKTLGQRKSIYKQEGKKDFKNHLKRELYYVLSESRSMVLPWGILTGVRPTKLGLEPLLMGHDEEDIINNYKKEYLCSDEKINLSMEIAKKEIKILEETDYKNSYSIYIGIPFCPTTCLYCSFTSYSAEKFSHMIDTYLDALMKEISYAKTAFPKKKLSTIYIGGGTPTTLSEEQLEHLLTHIASCFDISSLMEYTVEAGRPDSITRGKLEVLKKHGVGRISINPQTMNQRTLDLIGRKHTVEDIVNTYQLAREVGHDNINMDIIIGLPGENKDDVVYTLKEIEKLNPESLTVHTLAIKRAARLNIEKDNYKDMTAIDAVDMLNLSIDYAKNHGYEPYYLYRQKNMADNLENTGYSKVGKECIYNVLIMEEKQTIVALGAGSMSKFVFHGENRLERVDNVKSLVDYIKRIDEMIERKNTFINNNRNELERIYS